MKLGYRSAGLASFFLEAETAKAEDLLPTFERSLYYRAQHGRAGYEENARKFEADLERAIRRMRFWPQVLVFPAADQTMALGLSRFLKRHRFQRPPHVLFWLGMPPDHRKPIDDPSVAALLGEYQHAFSALQSALGSDGRLRLCTEEYGMTKAYQPHVGVKIETAFIPKLVQSARPRPPRRVGQPITIVCTGNANAAKGYALLPEALTILNRARSDLRFLIHGTVSDTDDPHSVNALKSLSQQGQNITVRTDVLPVHEYIDWLSSADLVLQPYDPVVYSTRGSGVFIETTKLGIPVVATQACDFAKTAIASGRAIGIDVLTPKGVADAICLAADQLERLSAEAARFAADQTNDPKFEELLHATIGAAQSSNEPLPSILARWLSMPRLLRQA